MKKEERPGANGGKGGRGHGAKTRGRAEGGEQAVVQEGCEGSGTRHDLAW